MEDYTDSILQDIILLSSDTLKSFIHMGGKISDLPDLKKLTVVLDIVRRWGNYIIKKGAKQFPSWRVGRIWSKGGNK